MAIGATARCLSSGELTLLLEGRLAADQRASADVHLADCSSCGRLIAALATSAGLSGEDEPGATSGPAPAVAANYEVEREVARGGMGKILSAWDLRHHRRVALKVLLRNGAPYRERFRREIRITARLQHPAIIPLYEEGRWSDGEPFFAMKLVLGRSLAAAIAAAQGTEERAQLLPHVIAACDALAYAHDQGVIHRDLKPSNVLVGAFGETVVIDWGLAKELDAPPEAPALEDDDRPDEGGALTVAGRALGTPAYMAPEQARGEPMDARADVYALGAMLYHLLSGRPPYEGPSPKEVIARVTEAPPAPLRPAPELPAAQDLIAIARKAMSRDPEARYATAGEMVSDLRRFTSGQRVFARDYSFASLAARWIGRHRLAVATAMAFVIGIGATAGVSVRRILVERDRADRLKQRAEQREHAEGARRIAAEGLVDYAMGELRTQLASAGRLELLAGVGTEIEKYYGGVAELDDAETPSTLVRRASGRAIMAEVFAAKHEEEAARVCATEAVALLERASRGAPDDAHVEASLVEAMLHLAARQETEPPARVATLRNAADRATKLAGRDPSDDATRILAAKAERALANALQGMGESEGAVDAERALRDVLARAVAAKPDDGALLRKLADAQANVGVAEAFVGLDDESLASQKEALVTYDRVVAHDADDKRAIFERAETLQLIGAEEVSVGHPEASVPFYTEAIAVLEQLVAYDSDNQQWREQLTFCTGGWSTALRLAGRGEEARQASLRMVQLAEELHRKAPDGEILPRTLYDHGQLLFFTGADREAIDSLRRAAEGFDRLLVHEPTSMALRWLDADTRRFEALAELRLSRPEAALASARRSVQGAEALESGSPADDEPLLLRARARGALGEVQVTRGDGAAAREALLGAVGDFQTFWERKHNHVEWLNGGPEAGRALAAQFVRDGDRAGAREQLETVRARLEELDAAKRLHVPYLDLLPAVRDELARLAP
ncbi:MAG TPA: serine/threonine-protein kinase [Polyangiaceae bacterium]